MRQKTMQELSEGKKNSGVAPIASASMFSSLMHFAF